MTQWKHRLNRLSLAISDPAALAYPRLRREWRNSGDRRHSRLCERKTSLRVW